MSGRGRPRKNNQPGETKQPTRPKKQEAKLQHPQDCTFKEQKPNEIKKEIKTAGKPPVQSLGEDEMIRQKKTDPGSKKTSVPRTKVRPSADGAKSTTSVEEKAKAKTKATTQIKDSPNNTRRKRSGPTTPDVELPEGRVSPPLDDTADNSRKITKEKKSGGKVKERMKLTADTKSDSQVQNAERRMGKAKSEIPKKLKMAPVKGEVLPDKTKLPERFAEGAAEMGREAHQETPNGSIAQAGTDGKQGLDSILHKTLEKQKIRKNPRAEAAEVVNNAVKKIVNHLKKNKSFEGAEQLNTGSYYENLKIFNPDEFDVMISVPVDRVEVKPFGETGAFYSVSLKRGASPLKKFELENNILSASQMLKEFREEVKESINGITGWEMQRKKPRCPAVTLITETPFTISMDVVLSLKVNSSWPSFTKGGFLVETWLGGKVKRDYKYKPYYLVPKYEGTGTVEKEGVYARDTWRVSFSNIEKAIMMNHGSEKTCCEAGGERCCRKDCLKLLKHLLHLLKEKDSTLHKFCSYHAKTTLLHACCSRNRDSDWRGSELGKCFQKLLEDFVGYLESGQLFNFFIPTQNLLSDIDQKKRTKLADKIREQQASGFPLFQ